MKARSILIVDDNTAFRRSLEVVLKAEGFDVIGADDGVAAMERFREQEFALVLLDIVMPKKEGFETLEEMLTLRPDQRVIVMTGGNRWVSHFYLDSALERGAAAVLGKPFRMDAMLAEISKLLGTDRH